MGKVLWHISMSLDGFVAGPGDDMTWLFGGDFAPDAQLVDTLLDQIGAVLIGHRTYHGGDTGGGAKTGQGRVYGGRWQGPQLVHSRDDPATAAPGFTILGGDITSAVETAKTAAGSKYLAIIGPGTAKKALDAGLVDEVLIHVAPVFLGDGVRLFRYPGGTKINLAAVNGTPQMANLWYQVSRDLRRGSRSRSLPKAAHQDEHA